MSLSSPPASSLRGRLIVGVLLIVPPILIAGGMLLDYLIGAAMYEQFDRALLAKAKSLALLVEQDEEGVDFELKDVRLPEFEPGRDAEYFQITLSDGATLAQSRSCEGEAFGRLGEKPATPILDIALGDGTIVRRALLATRAAQDEEFAKTGAAPIDVWVAVARPIAPLNITRQRIRLTLASVGGAVLLAIIALLSAGVSRATRPLSALSREIVGIASESLSTRLAIDNLPSEIAPVVAHLNDLLTRLESAFNRERSFTSDAAHELRTPLAGIRATVEVALLRERSPSELREALQSTQAIVADLQELLESLLMLARADAGAVGLNVASVDIRALLRTSWNELASRAAERAIVAEWHLEGETRASTDAALLRCVLRNVLRNAVQHADGDSKVLIGSSHLRAAGRITIDIENCCRDLNADHVAHVFDRFWRREQAHGTAADRYGIGLPLARAIVEQLGGSIVALMPSPGRFRITLGLPAQSPHDHN